MSTPTGQPCNQPAQPASTPSGAPTDQPTNQLTIQPTYRHRVRVTPTNQPTHRSMYSPTHQPPSPLGVGQELCKTVLSGTDSCLLSTSTNHSSTNPLAHQCTH
mmetsp:Transcript_31427/g.93743  ORF Transcript_31427/g.93743 Transcript_31427/m.93743 type:complete len:103 (-) Transcript_31427:119-427(-)